MSYISSPKIVPPDSDTYLYWPLNEPTGSNTFAQNGQSLANSGLITGATSVTAATFNPAGSTPVIWTGRSSPTGGGIDFVQHGASSCAYLFTTSENLAPSTTTVSVHGWFNIRVAPATGGQFFRLISKWDNSAGTGSTPDGFAILISNDGTQLYMYGQGSGDGTNTGPLYAFGPTHANFTRVGISTQKWHHVGFTFNSGAVIFYLDGDPIGQGTWTVSQLHYGTGSWSLGGSPVSSTGFDGMLSDWRVDNVVRAPGYFLNMYQRGAKG